MRIKLTPGQAVYLHGWLSARQTLTWGDVLADDTLKFDHLLSANLDEAALHTLQPDINEWVHSKRAHLAHCPRMASLWGARAITHFKAELGDIANQNWDAVTLVQCGVTYDALIEAGLTHESMEFFSQLTLMGWSAVGFSRAHASAIPEQALLRLFGMPKKDVLRSLK